MNKKYVDKGSRIKTRHDKATIKNAKLLYMQGYSFPQIGEKLSVNGNTVKTWSVKQKWKDHVQALKDQENGIIPTVNRRGVSAIESLAIKQIDAIIEQMFHDAIGTIKPENWKDVLATAQYLKKNASKGSSDEEEGEEAGDQTLGETTSKTVASIALKELVTDATPEQRATIAESLRARFSDRRTVKEADGEPVSAGMDGTEVQVGEWGGIQLPGTPLSEGDLRI